MVFGWFSKGDAGADKRLAKAQKLEVQGRWAEALSFYQEMMEVSPGNAEARKGARACRERLVACNIEEARAYQSSDPVKAREHARLALELAGPETDLEGEGQRLLASLAVDGAPLAGKVKVEEAPKPIFRSPCSCAAPCHPEMGKDDGELDTDDLFSFYLESLEPVERAALTPLSEAFREGYVRLQQGDLGGARARLQDAAREEPGAAGVHYALGLLASVEDDLGAAEAAFDRALAIDPALGPALRHRAEVLREVGRPDEAQAALSGWLEAHPEDAEARLQLAALMLERGEIAGARREAEAAQRAASAEDPRPALILARALRLQGQREGARRILQGVLNRKPDLLEALVLFAEILFEEGPATAERAAEAFKRCYQLDPDRGWWYLLRVASAYGAKGWNEEAREVLERAHSELPEGSGALEAWKVARARLDA